VKVDKRKQPAVEVVGRNKLLQADAAEHFWRKSFSSLLEPNLRIEFDLLKLSLLTGVSCATSTVCL